MASREMQASLVFTAAIEQWRKAGDAWQRIGNDSMRLICREMEAELQMEYAQLITARIPAADRSPQWRAKISA